jgi:hypothetical protein
MFPIHHTKTMGQILIRIFIVLIIAATLISCLQFVLMDGASFYDASKLSFLINQYQSFQNATQSTASFREL